jgi:hypothetical protein
MPAEFKTFDAALQWARVNGRDNTFPHQVWRVAKLAANKFRIGIYSRNTGALAGYAH